MNWAAVVGGIAKQLHKFPEEVNEHATLWDLYDLAAASAEQETIRSKTIDDAIEQDEFEGVRRVTGDQAEAIRREFEALR